MAGAMEGFVSLHHGGNIGGFRLLPPSVHSRISCQLGLFAHFFPSGPDLDVVPIPLLFHPLVSAVSKRHFQRHDPLFSCYCFLLTASLASLPILSTNSPPARGTL